MKRTNLLLTALGVFWVIPTAGITGCRHASPAPEEAAASEEVVEPSTLSGRLTRLGEEIRAVPETAAERMGPELDRLERLRIELDARVKKESAAVGKRMKKAVDSLEDDFRVLRSRITNPPPAKEAEPDSTESETQKEETAGE